MNYNATQSIDKELVARRFSHSRNTYDREACVQRQVAEKMMRLLTDTLLAEGISCTEISAHFRHIVEFGCGTGSYSRILLHTLQPETLLLNDLCREMEEYVGELCDDTVVRFLPGDAECLDFPEGTDLITSCSTLQWFNDPEAFFLRCHGSLEENGILAFSTFGRENMREISQLTGHGLEYLPLEELKALLSPYYDLVHAEEEIVTLAFPTPQEVLKHLKQTGVTGTEKKMWTRGRLQAFCEEYIRQFSDTEGKVNLTYHPIYIIARTKRIEGGRE